MRGAVKLFCLAAVMALPAIAHAQDPQFSRRTYLTFSGPVALPGMTLQAGSYSFEVADPRTSRKVITVDSRDNMKHYGYFLTVPVRRNEPSEKPVVMFSETPAGTPQAIKAWYYPNDRDGFEFVYPYDQAVKIASASHEPVMATRQRLDSSSKDQLGAVQESTIARVNESGQPTTVQPETTSESASSPSDTSNQAASSQRSSAVGTAGVQQPRRTLPRTASGLELTELLSMLSLGGAFAARSFRLRRRSTE